MLIAIAAIGITTALAIVGVRGVLRSAQSDALSDSVQSVNRAIGLYLASGGEIADDATAAQVVADLKRSVSAEDRRMVVGSSGGLVDPRTTVQMLPADSFRSGEERVIWNGQRRRFEVTTQSVSGARGFGRADDAVLPEGHRPAGGPVTYSRIEGWVWDYADGVRGDRSALDLSIPGGTIVRETPGAAVTSDPLKLNPPVFSQPGGLYPYEEFQLPVEIGNPNPEDGTSVVYYSIDGGGYVPLASGESVSVPRNAEVHAFVRSLDHDEWIDSDAVLQTYASESILFSGEAAGLFSNPVGDSGLVTNLGAGQSSNEFWFGDPANGYRSGNYLRFDGAEFADVNEGDAFVLGSLTYYNSTTYSGTNATDVTFNVSLDLRVPTLSETLSFDFALMSTPNRSSQTADQNADYVWLGDLSSELETSIGGDIFTMEIFFGQLDANGYTTIDTFHVHEGSTATGWLFGRLQKKEEGETTEFATTP